MFDAKRVGRRLRQLREERRLTQEKLAYECGRSKSYVCEIEAGKKVPSLAALGEFAERLGVPVFDLLVFPDDGERERLIDSTRGMEPGAITNMLAAALSNRKEQP